MLLELAKHEVPRFLFVKCQVITALMITDIRWVCKRCPLFTKPPLLRRGPSIQFAKRCQAIQLANWRGSATGGSTGSCVRLIYSLPTRHRGLYSIGFIASCRVAWFVARDPCLTQFVLSQPKNNFDVPQAAKMPILFVISSSLC
jgi:hypothetical protein